MLDITGKRIAIVEDDAASLKYYETLLKDSGAFLSVYRNGREFVDAVTSGRENFDLVFMDFLVPLVNGIECTRAFRQVNKSAPVILITAYYSEQTRNEAYIAGCTEYNLKPVFPDKIHMILEKYLSPRPAYQSYD
ncbi:MAG: response regulator [Bacteroidales bacterium]|nr:response regulator [Bacteroidales bacterium]MDT8373621.1 response regulator [Bacteroidales bacterium]